MDEVVNESLRSQIFSELWANPHNKHCFDCNNKDNKWASVSLGIYLCIDCAAKHRNAGVHLSFVKSCEWDKWKVHQLEIMQRGGNQRCKQFFEQRGISTSVDFNNKTALAEYKALLQSEVGITNGSSQDQARAEPSTEEVSKPKQQSPPKPKAAPKFQKKQAPTVSNYMFKPVVFEAPKPSISMENTESSTPQDEEELQDSEKSAADMMLVSQIIKQQKQCSKATDTTQKDCQKSVCSSDFNAREESKWEREQKRQRFQNASQISSAMYFNRVEDEDDSLGEHAEKLALAAKDQAHKISNKAKMLWSELTSSY